MAILCSWCGADIEEGSDKINFLCGTCAAKLDSKQVTKEPTKRPWKEWMPGASYPDLGRGDTRRA